MAVIATTEPAAALLMGAFITFSSFTITVAQRTREAR